MSKEREKTILQEAKEVFKLEAQAINDLARNLGNEFEKAVNLVYACEGRVVVTGLGKSGVIGQKIAATLASTGTPAIFLHASEALHGDLGMLVPRDLVIAISNSGLTEEVIGLLPQIKRLGIPLIAMTGNLKSVLAKNAEVVLNVGVKKEACPLGLAPTASTTAVLAMGDALAVVLINRRKFKPEDFSKLHPGGELSKCLIKIKDVMHSGKDIPKVNQDSKISEVILEINKKRFGCVGIIDNQAKLKGIFTDGDLRRFLIKNKNLKDLSIKSFMTKKPVFIREDELATKAVKMMQDRRIFVLLVINRQSRLIGIVHFLDLLDAGVV